MTIDRFANRLLQADTQTEIELRRVVDSVIEEAKQHLASYPPERPNQTYIRTGDLGEAWEQANPLIRPMQGGIEARLANRMPYSGFVQHPDEQAWMHAGRWDTTDQVVRDLQPLLDAELDRATDRLARWLES